MKTKEVVVLVLASIAAGLLLGIYIDFAHSVVKNIVHEESREPTRSYTGSVYALTNDVVEYSVTYSWKLTISSTDVEQLKINLLIGHIVQKHLAKYSSEDLQNQEEIIADLTERIDDTIFAIFPYGFELITLKI